MIRTFNPSHLYLLISLIFGAIYLVASGPFQAPDEYVHFYRAYDISQGNLRATVFQLDDKTGQAGTKKKSKRNSTPPTVGGKLPRSIHTSAAAVSTGIPFHPKHKFHIDHIRSELKRELNHSDKVVTEYYPAARLPAISYLPQSLGSLIGRTVEFSPLITFYVARLLNLLAAIIVSFLALRKLKDSGWTLCVLALSPIAIFLNSSTSPDAMISASALFVLCWFLVARNGQLDRRLGAFISLFFAVAIMVSGKVLFGGLLAIFLPIIIWRKKWRLLTFLTLASACAGVLLALHWTSLPLLGVSDPRLSADPSAQLAWMRSNPAGVITVVTQTIEKFWIHWRDQNVGVLGWLDTPLPSRVHQLFSAALFLAVLLDITRRRSSDSLRPHLAAQSITIGRFDILTILLGCVLSFFGILLSVYVLFNPVGAPTVEGVQGRYFIPIVFCFSLLVFALPALQLKQRFRGITKALLLLCVAAAHTITLQTLFKRYFFAAN